MKAGQLRLCGTDRGPDLLVRYDPPQLRVEVETIELEDDKLADMWGPRLHRVLLRAHEPLSSGEWVMRISPH